MQLPSDIFLAEAVEADRRILAYKLEIDWNRNGLFDHTYSDLSTVTKDLQVKRDVLSALPPETTMVDGYHAAQATARIGGTRAGDAMSIAASLSPWRTDSPLFGTDRSGCEVRIEIGHQVSTGGVTLVRQFTGVLLDAKVNSRRMEVEFVFGDMSETVQDEVSIPMYALPANYQVDRRFKINSQWLIDYVLRKNGRYMTPPRQTGCFWSATMHGSPIPEVGHQAHMWTGGGAASESDPVSWPGRPGWGLAYGGGPTYYGVMGSRTAATPFLPRASNSISVQFQADASRAGSAYQDGGWVVGYFSGGQWLSGAGFIVKLDLNGNLGLEIYNNSTKLFDLAGPNLGTAGWVDAWVRIDIGSSMASSTVQWVGGTSTAVDLSGISSSTVNTYPWVASWIAFPVSDIQICDATGLAAGATVYDPDTWVPEVDLDPGLNELLGTPLRRGVNSWALLKEIVGAEYGVIGFDEHGRLYFRNHDTIRNQNLTVEKTLDRDKMSEFGLSNRAGSVRNVITGAITSRKLARTDGNLGFTVVYDSSDPNEFVCPPGTSRFDIVLNSDEPIVNMATMTAYSVANWESTTVQTDHGFVSTPIGSGSNIGNVGVVLLPLNPGTIGPNRVRVFVVNSNDYQTVRLATPSGSAAFRVQGREYSPDKAQEVRYVRASSVAKFGSKVLEMPASEWHQTPLALQNIATSLLRDLARPVPTVDQIAVVGDCRQQLTDTLEVSDLGYLGGPMLTSLTGLVRSLSVTDSSARLVDQLTVRPYAAPGQWILGHPEWSVLGQTTIP